MNVYEAMMKAADHIEKNPRLFDFDVCAIPNECGTPGCALGWIGVFAGVAPGKSIHAVADYDDGSSILKVSQRKFYDQMDALVGVDWIDSASLCAVGLRRYAEKYHGDLKRNFARELERKLLTHQPEVA